MQLCWTEISNDYSRQLSKKKTLVIITASYIFVVLFLYGDYNFQTANEARNRVRFLAAVQVEKD